MFKIIRVFTCVLDSHSALVSAVYTALMFTSNPCPYNGGKLIASNCSECLTRFEVASDDIQIFYSNSEVRKSSPPPEIQKKVQEKFTSTNLSFIEERNNPGQFFFNKKNFIWHISDLHFRGDWLSFGDGHCTTLIGKFKEVLSKRGSKLKDDVFVLSGDLTDSGSKKDYEELNKFLVELESLGISRENLIFAPGNHDSWDGSSRAWMALGYVLSEGRLLKKAGRYEKRKFEDPLASFNEKASQKYIKTVNKREVEFIALNTCVEGEMARGVFPAGVLEPLSEKSLKIAIMHHHLIYPESLEYDYGYGYLASQAHKPTMRVINAVIGLKYLFENKFDISLHGHKHMQYFKYESQINSAPKNVLIVSSPSLSEKSYDLERGSSSPRTRIGFNIIIPDKAGVDLVLFDLRDWKYSISKNISC